MIPGAASGLVAGAGQPPTQDYSALLTALMGGGSLGSMQQGQTVNVQNAPPAPERALLDALSRSRDMQEAGYGYNPNATWGNVLQAILAPIAGRRREKKTEEKIREAMEAQARAARDGKEADFADYVRRKNFDAALEDSRKGEEDPSEWEQYNRILEEQGPEAAQRFAYFHGKDPNQAPQRGGVTVNTGEKGPQYGGIPQGWMVVDGRMVPVPGGPADQEAQAAEEAGEAAEANRAAKEDNVVDEIDHALGLLGGGTAGVGGALMRNVPGSDAVDFEAAMNTVLGNVGFDRLQRMREESPTGGALGQVSERELALLTSTVAGYDPNMSEDGKRRTLEKIRKHYSNFTQALNGEVPEEYRNLREKAQAAIEAGADPEKVMARLREMEAQQGNE